MAGIGFQLTKLMQKRTLAGGLHAYGFAALIGSGPWVLSMVTLAALGLVLHRAGAAARPARPGSGVRPGERR